MDFTPDRAAQEAKQKEIEALLEQSSEGGATLTPTQIKQLVDSFISISPPLDPPHLMTFTTMAALGRGGANSRKPGNITLNWRRLFDLVPDITLAGAGAVGTTWLLPVAALYVWMKLLNSATIKIEEKDAFVLYALWTHKNDKDRISEDDGFAKSNLLAEKHGMPPIQRDTFDRAVNKLSSLDCIELEAGIIWLREWVRIKY